jgi:hypothetical protein
VDVVDVVVVMCIPSASVVSSTAAGVSSATASFFDFLPLRFFSNFLMKPLKPSMAPFAVMTNRVSQIGSLIISFKFFAQAF